MAQILLVEPDRLLARIYYQALARQGHTVRICSSAQVAIFCADEFLPDIVLLELQLVAHSGIEFLYEFRSYTEWQNIPVLVLSHVPPGEFAASWKSLKHDLGVTAYLYKPATTLRALVQSVAEHTLQTA